MTPDLYQWKQYLENQLQQQKSFHQWMPKSKCFDLLKTKNCCILLDLSNTFLHILLLPSHLSLLSFYKKRIKRIILFSYGLEFFLLFQSKNYFSGKNIFLEIKIFTNVLPTFASFSFFCKFLRDKFEKKIWPVFGFFEIYNTGGLEICHINFTQKMRRDEKISKNGHWQCRQRRWSTSEVDRRPDWGFLLVDADQ